MTYKEKQLKTWYEKYIVKTKIYRIYSKEYETDIKTHGLTPKKNPYENQKKNILHFCKLLERLQSKGFNYVYMHWPKNKPDGNIIARVFRKSIIKKYIDLLPDLFDETKYYTSRKGGDMPLTIYHICQDLLKFNYPLTNKDKVVIDSLLKWSSTKIKYSNKILEIKSTSSYLEKAELQRFLGKPYLPSPFGSFEHFSKIIQKEGFAVYKPVLSGKEQFYIRIQHSIPAKEIVLK